MGTFKNRAEMAADMSHTEIQFICCKKVAKQSGKAKSVGCQGVKVGGGIQREQHVMSTLRQKNVLSAFSRKEEPWPGRLNCQGD